MKELKITGMTMVEAVLSTIILTLIAQILVYGYQLTSSTQSSSALSNDARMVDEANNCMEYVLRALDKNADQTIGITSAELAKCNTHCQRLSRHNDIKVELQNDNIQLFSHRKLKGSWITVTVSDPSTGRNRTVKTMVSSYDPNARTTSATGGYGRRMFDLNAGGRSVCATLDDYENQEYIPLSSLQYAKLRMRCSSNTLIGNTEARYGIASDISTLKDNLQSLIDRAKRTVFDEWFYLKDLINIFSNEKPISRPHCFADGRCISTGRELSKLYNEALTDRPMFETANALRSAKTIKQSAEEWYNWFKNRHTTAAEAE